MISTLAQTRALLAADLKRNPKCAHAKVVAKNLAILASEADDETKAAVLRVLPANVERFERARNNAL